MKPLWRIVVLVVGLVVLLAGVVMIVTPGPGIAAILLGLTILASEFRWARYWLVTAKRRALRAARRVRASRSGAPSKTPGDGGAPGAAPPETEPRRAASDREAPASDQRTGDGAAAQRAETAAEGDRR